jgi:hypothetical protein
MLAIAPHRKAGPDPRRFGTEIEIQRHVWDQPVGRAIISEFNRIGQLRLALGIEHVHDPILTGKTEFVEGDYCKPSTAQPAAASSPSGAITARR